jgi:hypothetical protein
MVIYAKIKERAGVIRIEMRWDRASGFEHETVYLRDYTPESKDEMITKKILEVMRKAKDEGTLIYI